MTEPPIEPAGAGDGCSNPIVGGGGALVYPAIASPNFNLANPAASPSPSWAILKSGLAYFVGLVLTGGTFTGTTYVINSAGAFFYSGPPAAGNLVESIAAAAGTDAFGNNYGAGYTSFSGLNSAELTAAALTFGAGLNTIASISPAGFFLYSPTAGLGNLVASITPAAGTDAAGNAYLAGITGYLSSGTFYFVANMNAGQFNLYQNASFGGAYTQYGTINVGFTTGLTMQFSLNSAVGFAFRGPLALQSQGAAAAATAGYSNLWASAGHLKYTPPDGTAYALDTGRVTGFAAGQVVSSQAPTFVALTGMTVPLGLGTWRFMVRLDLTAAAAAGQWQTMLLFSGTGVVVYSFKYTSAAGVTALNTDQTATAVTLAGPAVSVAGGYWAEIWGQITVTGAGNLHVSGATSAAADTWTLYGDSFIEAVNVT